MRKILLAVSALAVAVPAYAASLPPEAKLARALEGRVAGEPVDCISLNRIKSTRIIDDTAILYETAGGLVYVNRPDAGAESLNRWDALVTRTHTSRLCDIDVVHLWDPVSRFQTGSVFLGQFVPYARPKTD